MIATVSIDSQGVHKVFHGYKEGKHFLPKFFESRKVHITFMTKHIAHEPNRHHPYRDGRKGGKKELLDR